MLDPYRVLQIPRGSDQAAIKEAYIRLMREHHPDRLKDGNEEARQTRAQEINAAFALLKNAERRVAFDAHAMRKRARNSPGARSVRRLYRPRISVMARRKRLERIRLVRRLLLTVSFLSVVAALCLAIAIYAPLDLPWDQIEQTWARLRGTVNLLL